MGLIGKLVKQIELKSGGDVVYEVLKYGPHQISKTCPDKVQSCDLHQGEWGSVGSVISWTYTIDGKKKVTKEVIAAVDDEKKSITFKVIEGDLTEWYKTFNIIIQVDKCGPNYLLTWTFEYEKLNERVPDPNLLMDLILEMTKDIETHQHRITSVLVTN